MSEEVRDRKTEAFMIGLGAISIPFGAVLGALMANAGTRSLSGQTDLSFSGAIAFGGIILAMCGCYLVIPIVCIAFVRSWRSGILWLALALAAIVTIALLVPAGDFGIPRMMWLSITGAWMIACFALAYLCRVMNIPESFLR